MRKTSALLLCICLVVLLFSASQTSAQDNGQVGYVVALRGKVTAVDPQGNARTLSIKSPIYQHDTLKTGPQGRIQVLFSDNTIISLGKGSEMEITEHFWKPGQKTGAMKTKVKEGVFRVMGGAIAKDAPQDFTTETPAATIGIRGSMYAGRVADGSLSVMFEGGKGINVLNNMGEVSITRPGFGTLVQAPGTPPQNPTRFSTEEISGLNRDLAVENTPEQEETSSPGQDGGGTTPAQGQSGSGASQEGGTGSSPTGQGSEGQGEGQTGPSPAGDTVQTSQGRGSGSGEKTQTSPAVGSGTGSTFSAGAGSISTMSPSSVEKDLASSPIMPTVFFEPIIVPQVNPVTQETGTSTPDQGDDTEEMNDQSDGGTLTNVTEPPTTTTEPPTNTREEPTTNTQTPPHEPVIADLTGAHQGSLVDANDLWNSANTSWYAESTTARSTDGNIPRTITVSDTTNSISSTFTNNFRIPPYNPSGTYSALNLPKSEVPYTVNLLGLDRTFTMRITADPKGEFAFYSVFGSFVETVAYEYAEMGYLGVPSVTNFPGIGIDSYRGPSLGFENIGVAASTWKSFGAGEMFMEVNWLNGKAIGFMDFDITNTSSTDYHDLLIFFGDVDRTNGTLTNVVFLGDRGSEVKNAASPVLWIDGNTFLGQFYGSENQGFGFMGTGNDYDVSSNMSTRIGTSRINGAGLRGERDPIDSVSPTGTVSLSGYVAGVSEQMSMPMPIVRRVFMNTIPSDFLLNINRDQGTISGMFSADDIVSGNASLIDVEVGDSHGSAYVLDDRFVAVLGDSGFSINTYAMFGGLKPQANYLVTAKPSDQLNDFISWGYWEIAYEDPADGLNYHVHSPGAFWIAGQQTNPAVIQGMVSNSFIGHYTGGAQGVRFDSTSQLMPLTNGVTDITVNFGSANPISGWIRFTEVQLDLVNGVVDEMNSQLSADIQISGFDRGGAFGSFYGPNAEAIGGNFEAENGAGGVRYIGIFHGDRN